MIIIIIILLQYYIMHSYLPLFEKIYFLFAIKLNNVRNILTIWNWIWLSLENMTLTKHSGYNVHEINTIWTYVCIHLKKHINILNAIKEIIVTCKNRHDWVRTSNVYTPSKEKNVISLKKKHKTTWLKRNYIWLRWRWRFINGS